MRTAGVPIIVGLFLVGLLIAAAILFERNLDRNMRIINDALAAADDPDFELYDLDGRLVMPWGDRSGEVVAVIFTRTDCPISNRYAPDVRALCEKFGPRGVAFYLVYVDPRETAEAIRKHLAEYEYPCAALRDPKHTLIAATGATVTPEAVVFDEHMVVKYRGRINDRYNDIGDARSEATTNDLADALEATLAGRPVAEPVTKAVGCYIGDLN